MVAFEVTDMTCGGCAARIIRLIQGLDRHAAVRVDVSRRTVEISQSTLAADVLGVAIASAGYTPVLVSDGAPRTAPAKPPVRSGCCCG